jgi:hypothetical protein
MTDTNAHSNIASGFASLVGSTPQWRRIGAFARRALALKYDRTNGDLIAAIQLLQPQETRERCAEMARGILENEDVRFLESIVHDQLVEAERDARAKERQQ